MSDKLNLMYGSLLHDVGKIIYRGNSARFGKGTHSKLGYEYLKEFDKFNNNAILNSIKYHHYKELSHAQLSKDDLAYITYIADNIASGADRRDVAEEGDDTGETSFSFDKSVPLSSIFNIVKSDYNNTYTTGTYAFGTSEITKYPSETPKSYSAAQYSTIIEDMSYDLRNTLEVNEKYFSSLLQWIESLWQYIPSSTNKKQMIDVSLYDHSKITCGLACCIYDYLQEQQVNDYKAALFSPYDQTKVFYAKESFLLLSLDMSGIQDFIYNISGQKALKRLRARSFYLEMMLEVIVDELLTKLELSRANLLYTGGGHAYLLLANTQHTKDIIANFENELKAWFIDNYKIDLSVALAYEPCSGNQLMNASNSYSTIWRNLSKKLSRKKAGKYSMCDILKMNQTHSYGDRECKECLRSDIAMNDNGICRICDSMVQISNDLRDKPFFIISNESGLIMPFDKFLQMGTQQQAEKLIKSDTTVSIYSKNKPYVGKDLVTNLWMCDYDAASKDEESRKEGIASYAINRTTGIKRLGVLRADIDNLGQVFISGIDEQYNSLSRTATLSRQLSMFFKHEVTNILESSNITVIYSGGDDLFLIGAWDDVVIKAIEIREKFKQFTMDKLSFSAGIGMFKAKYPVSKMAQETGILEELAKKGDKNQITLWFENEDRILFWDDLADYILGEKLKLVRQIFTSSEDHGKSFIYKLMNLLRNGDEINIAKIAYLIARSKLKDEYASKLMKWSTDSFEKKDLIIALEYYIYEVREG